jgi:uncharacterized 2Fe-2S/4Fe-4S cluster protein (DUF4445 family)
VAEPEIEPGTAGCEVTFQPLGRRIVVTAGTTLLEAGRRAGLLLCGGCGGVGICGRCRVSVSSGNMFPPDEEERDFLAAGSYSPGTRLACEARVASSVTVEAPLSSFPSGQRLQVEGDGAVTAHDPIVKAYQLQLCPPSLDDSRSDYRRVADALDAVAGHTEWEMLPGAASCFSSLARKGRWNLNAYTRRQQVIGFANCGMNPVGVAVDVGCTKIAVYLVDLCTGAELAASGTPNPQIPYGEDLISRLVYAAASTEKAKSLAVMVRECILQVCAKLCDSSQISKEQIADICVVGNTAMMHLLLNLPVAQLLSAPFVASIDRDVDVPASDLGWQFAPGTRVHVLPTIGGFVGADHVAMIMARNIDRCEKLTVGLDIGTNTEIVVRDPGTGSFLTTSVPSGPVFEGGHVSDGMRAASGAIEKFYSLNGTLRYTTIDGTKPIGICGSGIVDLLAELRRIRCIDERGHLSKTHALVQRGRSGARFLVAPAADTGHGRDIVLTQQDITQVQLAKAAIFAGIETLLQLTGVSPDDVQQLVVAGAFGSYLDLRSAVSIGMLPRFQNAEYLQVGNAAGAGAKLALVSKSERERARKIAEKAKRIELKQYAIFDRSMARATRFPELRSLISHTASHTPADKCARRSTIRE